MRTAKSLGANDWDAEDVAQEAIVRLLPLLSKIDRPEGMLFIIVRNLVFRQHRRRSNRARIRFALARDSPEVHSPVSNWRARIDVLRLLAAIRPRSRQLLALVLNGHTHCEIADTLGCETHQVGPRIRRALETARRRLAVGPSDSPDCHRRLTNSGHRRPSNPDLQDPRV